MQRSPQALSLTYARRDIPQYTFGFIGRNWCDDCKGFDDDLEYRRTYRQTWEQPEEGIEICPHCGREAAENDQDHAVKLVAHWKIERKI